MGERRHPRGAVAVEYGLLLFAVVLASAVAIRKLGPRVAHAATRSTSALAGGDGAPETGARSAPAAAAAPARPSIAPPSVPPPVVAGTVYPTIPAAAGDPVAQQLSDREALRRAAADSAAGRPLTNEQRELARRVATPRITDAGSVQIAGSVKVQRNGELKGNVAGLDVGTRVSASTKAEAGVGTGRGAFGQVTSTLESQNRVGAAGVTVYEGRYVESTGGTVTNGSRVGVEVKRDVKAGSVAGYGELQDKDGKLYAVLGVKGSRKLDPSTEVQAAAELKVRPPRGTGYEAEIAQRLLRQDEKVRTHQRTGGTGFPPGLPPLRP